MKARRKTLLAAAPVLAGLLTIPLAGPVGATFDPGYAPMARGDNGAPGEEPVQEACPTDLWAIPVEVPGIACILLLEQDEDE